MTEINGAACTRPLEQASAPATPERVEDERDVYLAAGAVTHIGRVKERNQDSLFAVTGALAEQDGLLPLGLYIVSDGMGQDEAGTQASVLTTRLVANRILDRIYRPYVLAFEQTLDRQPIHQVLRDSLLVANDRVRQVCPGGKTTCTCALVLGMNVFVAHVGDSRAYLIDADSVGTITTDHSLVNRLIELGQITEEEAQVHPQRNVLYRAIGRDQNLEVDTGLQPLSVGDSLLLCSDGLWGALTQDAILAAVHMASSPQMACRQLVAQANACGGYDNITAILVQVRD
jgi:serine/threonine protein phosphatase PrpC